MTFVRKLINVNLQQDATKKKKTVMELVISNITVRQTEIVFNMGRETDLFFFFNLVYKCISLKNNISVRGEQHVLMASQCRRQSIARGKLDVRC